jgi:hypothetical protein
MASEIHRDERADDLSDEGLARQKPASQEDVGRDEHASRVAEGKTLGKVLRPAPRRWLAVNAVARHRVSALRWPAAPLACVRPAIVTAHY